LNIRWENWRKINLLYGFIFEILQRFFLGIGGIARWFFFQAYNLLYVEKYPTDLDYYIDNKNKKIDKNSLTVQNKNFFSGMVIFILIIFLIEKMENYK